MIYYLSSKDPQKYGTVSFESSFSPFMQSKRIAYRVSSLSTIANISVTTRDDYIVLSNGGDDLNIIPFNDHGPYDPNLFERELAAILSPYTVSIDSLGRVNIGSSEGFVRIVDASHRVKLLLGLYHTSLPIEGIGVCCPSAPYLCYGNVLYLLARRGPPVGFAGSKNTEEYHSIVYKSSEFLYKGLPVICRHDGITIRTTADAFRSIEFTLVDMDLQPIELCAPLHVTIEVTSDDTLFDTICIQ